MEGDLDFSQRGTKVTLGTKAKARSLKKDAAGTQQPPKGPRSKVPSISWRRTPGKGHPLPYAWNRGGRLRELRSRCLARKFFLLWAQQTFGRVLPSRARHHYETRLLQRTFEAWREEWWVVRREWKLGVRADCHYRYSLYNLMFQAWQTYVRQRRDKKSKYRRAEDHAAKQKLWLAWKRWLIYVDVRRTKRDMYTVAQEFRQQSILRVPWRVWRRQVRKSHVGRLMDAVALQHWGTSLQFWAWSQWQEQFLHIQIIRKKETEAVRHCMRQEQRRALTAWRGYLQGRRERQHQAQLAGQFHCAVMVRTSFLVWRVAWQQRKLLHAHQARIEALAARITLRQAFERWKRYMLISAEDAAFQDMAEKHHRQRLVLSCFRALKDNVKNSRRHRLRKNLAHGQYQAMLLQRFWRRWCARAEWRENERWLPQLLCAHVHFREALLHKCLRLWSQKAQESRRKQMQSAKAEHHYRSRNLSILFEAWKSFSRQRREQRMRRVEASNFHRELVTRRAFDMWWQKMCLQRETRLSERTAILHAEWRVLRQYWSTWRWRAAELSVERGGQATACAHYRHRQLRKTFWIWKENLQALQAQQAGEMRAAVFNSGLLLRLTWSKWREYMALQNVKWQKAARADRHYHQVLLRRALAAWMIYQGRVKAILRQVAEREDQHHRELLWWVFRRWRENTAAQTEEARKTLRAEEHYRRAILWKVAIHWRDTASLRIRSRQQKDVAATEARERWERGRLRASFQHWRECGRRASLHRAQLWRAAQHHGRRLLKTCMARWKKYHVACIRKMLLQRQSVQLMAQRLRRSSFSTWKRQLGEKQREQHATVRALWLWSFTLQGKVWDAWLGFVLERRRKKARLERAALAYHGSLLHEGVTRLLTFMAGMKSFRGHFHAQRQAQVARNLHQVVHRCATRWKRKALAKDRAASWKRVTFEVPVTDAPSAATGEAAVDVEQSRAPQRPSKPWGWPLQLASGDPYLPDLNVVRPIRKQPRCPSFLLDSLEKEGTAGRLCPGLLAETAVPLLPAQPGPSATLAAPGPSIRPWADSRSLPKPRGHRPLHTEATPPPLSSIAGDRDPIQNPAVGIAPPELGPREPAAVAETECPQPGGHLLLPEDFLGSKGRPSLGLGASGGVQADIGGRVLGILGDGGELEAELEEIQEKLFSYQANKQSLRSWQRQASSLRRWLALSTEDPRPEEEEAGRQVRQELHQVEKQIAHLTEELRAERQQVQRYVARIQVLRVAFS
ncbi:protein SFI1 homolog isoform X2 [Phascolarctos cinereus]|uniref:Protein SFI1 homolog isoform X2 n=1 Tax=Phascolarctos cinereus TaxID=38626 RepID=A0A6P5L1Z3_PHACI|nr:protein SFI1 homolog isoform X2 [Phascolarctos cinereus]